MPLFDPPALERLAEKTDYEVWMLEAVYALVEQELFPEWSDGVVYPLDRTKAQFFVQARANIVIGDWRPGFLKVGAPLVFVATFKLLDMFLEWVLETNGGVPSFRFQEKLRQLERPQVFPPFVEARPWLKKRILGLYRTIQPLRGTIIHDRHFTVTDGALRVSGSKGAVGSSMQVEPSVLRKLALTTVSILRYVDGTWKADDFRERRLRYDFDELEPLHGAGMLGQKSPFHARVRVYVRGGDPLNIDPVAIRADLEQHYLDQDCSFDVRVLLVDDGAVIDAYLFPWSIFAAENPDWRHKIEPALFRTALPEDINPQHLISG